MFACGKTVGDEALGLTIQMGMTVFFFSFDRGPSRTDEQKRSKRNQSTNRHLDKPHYKKSSVKPSPPLDEETRTQPSGNINLLGLNRRRKRPRRFQPVPDFRGYGRPPPPVFIIPERGERERHGERWMGGWVV